MFVSNILKDKGRRIVSVGPEKRIDEIAKVLTRERIGAVLVRDETGTLVGVLSERDIVAGIARQGGGALTLHAHDLMTADVVTCKLADSVPQVMAMMTERRIRHLPVVEDNQLIGLISIGDVVKHRLAEVEGEAEQMRQYITTA